MTLKLKPSLRDASALSLGYVPPAPEGVCRMCNPDRLRRRPQAWRRARSYTDVRPRSPHVGRPVTLVFAFRAVLGSLSTTVAEGLASHLAGRATLVGLP